LNSIEVVAEAVWMDVHLGKDWGEYRYGVKFINISEEDLERLKKFIKSLSD
jgi:c-di-GMP-binding flagellar brake protein YcgR